MIFMAGCIYTVSIIVGGQDIHLTVRLLVGLATAASGAMLLILSIASFRRNATTVDPVNPDRAQTLVMSGVFRMTRNPMYVAMSLWLISVCMIVDSLAGLIFVPVFVINLTRNQIRREEAVMANLFGNAYQTYRRTTPRWLWRKG
jgi:protein-S-isoprenylcysteine O-methyltransferase Ste14